MWIAIVENGGICSFDNELDHDLFVWDMQEDFNMGVSRLDNVAILWS